MEITHTITALELLWTVCAVIGLYSNLSQLLRARLTRIDLDKRGINSIRKYAANTTFFMFFTWSTVQAMFLIIGISAMTQPSPHNKTTHTGFIIGVSFVITSVFLSFAGIIIDHRREYLVNFFKANENSVI